MDRPGSVGRKVSPPSYCTDTTFYPGFSGGPLVAAEVVTGDKEFKALEGQTGIAWL
jgi:hypothetical protein